MIDSNAAQFERLGNPWVSERDRRENWGFPQISRKVKKAPGKTAAPRPVLGDEATVRRALTAKEARDAKHRANLALVRSFARAGRGDTGPVRIERQAPPARAPLVTARLDPLGDEAIRLEGERLAALHAADMAKSAEYRAGQFAALADAFQEAMSL